SPPPFLRDRSIIAASPSESHRGGDRETTRDREVPPLDADEEVVLLRRPASPAGDHVHLRIDAAVLRPQRQVAAAQRHLEAVHPEPLDHGLREPVADAELTPPEEIG